MVGGVVIETLKTSDGTVWMNIKDNHSSSQSAIHVKADAKARSVSPGDSMWWQGESAFWSPNAHQGAGLKYPEILLCKVGNSGASRPRKDEILR